MIQIDSSKIKWIKNIKREKGKEWAYFDNYEDDEFPLHWSNRLKSSASKPAKDDLIILFQNYKNQGVRITHIVKFIDDADFIDEDNHVEFQTARKVKIIYRTKHLLNKVSFSFDFHSVSYGHANHLKYLTNNWSLNKTQNEIHKIITADFTDQFNIKKEEGKYFINFPTNKLCNTPQSIITQSKIITLIGENGCGKSAILESVFKASDRSPEYRTIAFSSGQNESFTNLFDKIQRDNKESLFGFKELNETEYQEKIFSSPINAFYFNYEWAKLLIFFASVFKTNGLVSNFLKKNGYIDFSQNGIDLTTMLKINVRVNRDYTNKIRREIRKEEKGIISDYLKSQFHNLLTRFIEYSVKKNYDFEEPIVRRNVILDSTKTLRIFEEKNIDLLFNFFWFGINNSISNFDLNNTELYLKGLELNDLSDGEYQLLSIYAIFDLFDSDRSVFLLDEIDTHIHYSLIKKIWQLLKAAKGTVITSTHILDSVLNTNFSGIKYVKSGAFSDNYILSEIISRIDDLSSRNEFQFSIAAKAENIVLIDNINDWKAFISFLRIKVPNYHEEKLSDIEVINVSSGRDNDLEQFGNNKIKWIEEFQKANSSKDISTKNIFMICDRDNSNPEYNSQNPIKVNGYRKPKGLQSNVFLLAWQRREIENYFISHTLLSEYGLVGQINDELIGREQLQEGNSMDHKSVKTANVKDSIKQLYCINDEGLDVDLRQQIINKIPPSEISEDIENMYNFIASKVN